MVFHRRLTEGSDAESGSDWKWRGVPRWEIQLVYTIELIGQDLVERENLGKHH